MERLDVRLVPAALTGWAVTAAGIVWEFGAALTLSCALIAGTAALLAYRCPAERAAARAVAVAVFAAAVVGTGFGCAITLRSNDVRTNPVTDRYGTVTAVEVLVTESPRPLGSGRVLLRADLRMVDGLPARGRVVVFGAGHRLAAAAAGQPVRLRARISAPRRRDLTVATLNATGDVQIGRAVPVQRAAALVRARFAEQAQAALPGDQAAMLPALVLGDTSTVDPVIIEEFKDSGLMHLTAVSGANVTIVCGAVLFVGGLAGPRCAVAAAAVALLAFVIVVQPTASVLRAAVMGAVALLAVLTSRQRQAVPALAGTVLVLLALAPQLAVDAGFALSVAATAALVVLAPVWSQRLVERGWPPTAAHALCLAWAAQLVTAPLVAGMSGKVSVVAVAANIAAAPLIVPITVLGTTAAAISPFWPTAAGLLIRFTGPELSWVMRVAHWSAGIPNATVAVPSGAAGVCLVAVGGAVVVIGWGRRWFRAAAAVAVLVALSWSASAWAVGTL